MSEPTEGAAEPREHIPTMVYAGPDMPGHVEQLRERKARIQEAAGSMFARTGDLFREQVHMSGVVPQVAAMMGPGAAGTAYIPGLADFVPMVKGTSNMALGGPHLVKAAVGEVVTAEEMGGSAVHSKVSGVADLEVADERECIEVVRRYLGYVPSSNWVR